MAQAVKFLQGSVNSNNLVNGTLYTCPASTIAKIYFDPAAYPTSAGAEYGARCVSALGNLVNFGTSVAILNIAGGAYLNATANQSTANAASAYISSGARMNNLSTTDTSASGQDFDVTKDSEMLRVNGAIVSTADSINTAVTHKPTKPYVLIEAGDTVSYQVGKNGTANGSANLTYSMLIIEEAAS